MKSRSSEDGILALSGCGAITHWTSTRSSRYMGIKILIKSDLFKQRRSKLHQSNKLDHEVLQDHNIGEDVTQRHICELGVCNHALGVVTTFGGSGDSVLQRKLNLLPKYFCLVVRFGHRIINRKVSSRRTINRFRRRGTEYTRCRSLW